MFFIKLSILLQYMKIFVPAGTRNLMYWGIQIVIWLNLAFYSIGTLVEIFACTPREKFWDVTITTGHCIDRNAINVASSAVNSCSDFITLLLPQKAIWDLQMPLRRKLAISSVFLTRFL